MTRSLAQNILRAAAAEGIRIRVDAGDLRLTAPPGLLTPEVVAFITSHKSALLALLTRKSVPSHVPGIVWDPRGGVRVADPVLYPMSEIDPADPEGSREVMLEQACQRQAEIDEAEEVAFFTEMGRQQGAAAEGVRYAD
jgi:hypothetical protein